MKISVAIALSLVAVSSIAQEAEIQRSVIQRDQQSAEFAARLRGADVSSLEQLHARQLSDVMSRSVHPDPQVARQLQGYQRQQMADERVLALPPPVTMVKPPLKPLPLPGGPKHGVEPIPVESSRN